MATPPVFAFTGIKPADLLDPQLLNLNNLLRNLYLGMQNRYGVRGPIYMFDDINMQGHVLINVGPTMHTVSLREPVALMTAERPNLDAAVPPVLPVKKQVAQIQVTPKITVADMDAQHARITVSPGVKDGVAYPRRVDTVAKPATGAAQYSYGVDLASKKLVMSASALADVSNLAGTATVKHADAA